jgi:hypothetical protein
MLPGAVLTAHGHGTSSYYMLQAVGSYSCLPLLHVIDCLDIQHPASSAMSCGGRAIEFTIDE